MSRSLLDILRDAWTIAAKDVRAELRSKEILLTMAYFGFLVVLIFAFSFFHGDAPISVVAAGILWVSISFSGTLGLGRIFDREREGDCMKALLLAPVARTSIFLGKAAGVFVFMGIVEIVVVPSVFFFFNLGLSSGTFARLALTLVLGTLGHAIIGTLLAGVLQRARSKEVLLAIVFYPIILPVIIVGVKATAALFDPSLPIEDFSTWVRLLTLFDVVFLVASLWIFEPLVTD